MVYLQMFNVFLFLILEFRKTEVSQQLPNQRLVVSRRVSTQETMDVSHFEYFSLDFVREVLNYKFI